MTRAILDEAQIHPAARPLIGSKHQDIVRLSVFDHDF